ncbi:hypothetical protein NGRA_1802 [Nosema granulosis]|uniref:Uncharacterized protein n=1 Tax=Nosema granulosis TaxID=83296 RepID=A0A9P6GZC3_9MICR|nr:hypothetical protein NGRA_1802 [Nosema granulosis]
MVLRKYRYIALKIRHKGDVVNPTDSVLDEIRINVKETVLFKLCNMSLLDILEQSKIFIIRVDRSVSRELIESLKEANKLSNKVKNEFEILLVSGIYKRLLKKVQIFLNSETT